MLKEWKVNHRLLRINTTGANFNEDNIEDKDQKYEIPGRQWE